MGLSPASLRFHRACSPSDGLHVQCCSSSSSSSLSTTSSTPTLSSSEEENALLNNQLVSLDTQPTTTTTASSSFHDAVLVVTRREREESAYSQNHSNHQPLIFLAGSVVSFLGLKVLVQCVGGGALLPGCLTLGSSAMMLGGASSASGRGEKG